MPPLQTRWAPKGRPWDRTRWLSSLKYKFSIFSSWHFLFYPNRHEPFCQERWEGIPWMKNFKSRNDFLEKKGPGPKFSEHTNNSFEIKVYGQNQPVDNVLKLCSYQLPGDLNKIQFHCFTVYWMPLSIIFEKCFLTREDGDELNTAGCGVGRWGWGEFQNLEFEMLAWKTSSSRWR